METPPNATKIRRGVYVVRTQAGFKRSLKEFWQEMGCDGDRIVHRDYPRHYPSLVVMNLSSGPYEFVSLDIFPFNQLHDILNTHD